MLDLDAGKRFLHQHRQARAIITPHPDADGLAGAALVYGWLHGERRVLCPEKGGSVHAPEFGQRLREAALEVLIVIDQGSRPGALLPGVPTLTIDHHVPTGIPEGVFVTAHQEQPVLSAAHLCYLLTGEEDDWLWITAVGVLGDYGSSAPFEILQQAKKRYTAKALQETAALVNAGRRGSRYDWEPALRLLLTADDPRQISRLELPEAEQLQTDREEVNCELQRARKSRPFIAAPWAVIPFASPCLVHALVAGSWIGRLKSLYVVAANFGYRPGYVHFSIRSSTGADLITALRGLAPEGLPGEWGHGHRAATGGSLAVDDFMLLVGRMGYSAEQIEQIQQAGLS